MTYGKVRIQSLQLYLPGPVLFKMRLEILPLKYSVFYIRQNTLLLRLKNLRVRYSGTWPIDHDHIRS